MKAISLDIPFEEIPFHLGLEENDTVFISSDLKNFALKTRKEGKSIDVNLFIDNLQKIVKNGTIVIPVYTDYLKDNGIFDYQKSKPSTGAISNRVLRRKDFIRTTDPLHSVCVWGRHQEEIFQLKEESTFGENSIFGYLNRVNGVFLFFDVHIIDSYTYVHYLEEQLDVPYRKYKNWSITVKKDGGEELKKLKFHTKKWGVVNNFDELNHVLLEEEKMERYSYGSVYIDKTTAEDTQVIVERLIQEKRYLYHFSWKEYLKSLVKRFLRK